MFETHLIIRVLFAHIRFLNQGFTKIYFVDLNCLYNDENFFHNMEHFLEERL